jgi:hypothetical protein
MRHWIERLVIVDFSKPLLSPIANFSSQAGCSRHVASSFHNTWIPVDTVAQL